MLTKYNFSFNEEIIGRDLRRLINQLWKLIPMKENSEDWQGHLQIVIEEISGLGRVLDKNLDFLILLSKLEGLFDIDDFMLYRKIVFRCIRLLSGVVLGEDE